MALTIKLRQGTKSQLSTLSTGMTLGEPLYVTDTLEMYVATGATTKKTAVIDLGDLEAQTSGGIHGDDLLYTYDVSVTGIKAKKMTFNDFKTALNIPAGSTDELVAIASGQAAGYLGSNGTDGVLRVNANGLKMTNAAGIVTMALSMPSEAQGDLIYRGASEYARLAAGTVGHILQSGGAGANPSWLGVIDGGAFA
jgi:hypothetical protein